MRPPAPLILLFTAHCATGCGGDPITATTDGSVAGDSLGRSYEEAARTSMWSPVAGAPSVRRGKQDDLFFSSPRTAFAVSGPTGRIYRSRDGGATWSTALSSPGTYFRSLLFVNELRGFASNLGPIEGAPITDRRALYRTDDGGDHWAPVDTIQGPMPAGLCNQTMSDPEHLFAVGRVTGPSFLLRSTDGGDSYLSTDLGASLGMLIDARFTTPDEGLLVGGTASTPMRCTILHTSDGGRSLQPVFVATAGDTLCWKIHFPSAAVGYVSIQNTVPGSPATFAKTVDGGMTWEEKPLLPESYSSIGIGFLTEMTGWVSSDDPAAPSYKTIDGGETWTVDASLPAPINRFRFLDRRTAFAIGGTIHRLEIDWPAP